MVFSLLRKQVRRVQRKGVKVVLHCCENTFPNPDDLFDYVGIDGYHAIEPMAGMDIATIKEKYGSRISLFGNVDCSQTLCSSTTEEAKTETIDVLRKAAYGGGHSIRKALDLPIVQPLDDNSVQPIHRTGDGCLGTTLDLFLQPSSPSTLSKGSARGLDRQ